LQRGSQQWLFHGSFWVIDSVICLLPGKGNKFVLGMNEMIHRKDAEIAKLNGI